MPSQTTRSASSPLASGENAPPSLEQAAFGAGSIATGIFITVPGLMLLYYLTDTLGVAAGLAGIVVVVPRLLDIVTNPVVGRLSDRTQSNWGPRRPWMMLGGTLFPVAFVLLFWGPLRGGLAALWVLITFTLSGLCFAAYIVPWSSLPAEVGGTSPGRTAMVSWRTAFVAVGILISGGFAPVLVEAFGSGIHGYRVMALCMAALMIVAVMVSVLLGARRSTADTKTVKSVSLKELFRLLKASRPLRKTLVLIMLCEIGTAIGLTAAPYIADYIIGSEASVAILFIALVAPLGVAMPWWTRFSIRRGKDVALHVASILFAIGSLGLVLLYFIEGARLPVAATAMVVMGVGFAGTSMLPQAMLADAVANESSRSGLRQAGVVTGAANAAETMASSLAAGLYAALLAVSGFISSESEEEKVTQPDSALFTIVGAVGFMAAVAAMLLWLTLRRYKHEDSIDDHSVANPSQGV
ncbi:MFS transporter [Streptomyces chartreusis]|uniref:MFS transporter n=1 Tax=Streptomyces chartreusis TaxID=1969 RepID=UPI002F90A6A6|nr:MFS transporter [Streptomyces chartreusis]WTA33327.1 MFS transporter [Streptomyces chartreusis]